MPPVLDRAREPAPIPGFWLDLGLMPYGPAFAVQEKALKARIQGKLGSVVILQENTPVFTIGRSGSQENILTPVRELKQRRIEVLEVNRGGDVTYHGPGQLIVSPLLYLGDMEMNANQFMHGLEDVIMDLLTAMGIPAFKKEKQPGVWHEKGKIAAVGIAVKHGFTFHGFSLNLDPDLEAFDLINPCGVHKMPVTSIREVLGWAPDMAEIKGRLREILERTFGLETRTLTAQDLAFKLNP